MRTTTFFPTISPSSTTTTISLTSTFSISAPTLRTTTTTSTLPLFVLPPPLPPTGTGTSTALPSVAPIPTEWPSMPPGLISPGPPNVGAPSPTDITLTASGSVSPSPPDGANQDAGDPGSPPAPLPTGSSDSSSSPFVASTSTTSPSPNQTPTLAPGPTTSSGLQANSQSSRTTPVEDIPRTTNAAGRASVHTRVVAALVLLWLSVMQLGWTEVLGFG